MREPLHRLGIWLLSRALAIPMSVGLVLVDVPADASGTAEQWLQVTGITEQWATVSSASAPAPRRMHTAVWTGTEMIIWGGQGAEIREGRTSEGSGLQDGGRYNPALDTWHPLSVQGAPSSRMLHTAIWTGTEMVVWGGSVRPSGQGTISSGAAYNPVTDRWRTLSDVGAPQPRARHVAVWMGSEMLVWGGVQWLTGATSQSPSWRNGARYNPMTDAWTPISTLGAPGALGGDAVWTGSEMIVWHAETGEGAAYNPAIDRWRPLAAEGAPANRREQTALWTGQEMIIWGGLEQPGPAFSLSGAAYNPRTATWRSLSPDGAPAARAGSTPVWTGDEMIIWGGRILLGSEMREAAYRPITDSWRPISMTGAPSPRNLFSLTWTGSEMILWGGWTFDQNGERYFGDGARYTSPPQSWLVAHNPTQAYSITDDALWVAQPGEWYRLIKEEGGWALAVWEFDDPYWAIWIRLDERVALTTPWVEHPLAGNRQ